MNDLRFSQQWLRRASCWFLAWLTFQPWRSRQYFPPKGRITSTELYGFTFKKTVLFINYDVRHYAFQPLVTSLLSSSTPCCILFSGIHSLCSSPRPRWQSKIKRTNRKDYSFIYFNVGFYVWDGKINDSKQNGRKHQLLGFLGRGMGSSQGCYLRRTTQTWNKLLHTFMTRVGWERTIKVFERAETFRAFRQPLHDRRSQLLWECNSNLLASSLNFSSILTDLLAFFFIMIPSCIQVTRHEYNKICLVFYAFTF
jgi:hypothetical protein